MNNIINIYVVKEALVFVIFQPNIAGVLVKVFHRPGFAIPLLPPSPAEHFRCDDDLRFRWKGNLRLRMAGPGDGGPVPRNSVYYVRLVYYSPFV